MTKFQQLMITLTFLVAILITSFVVSKDKVISTFQNAKGVNRFNVNPSSVNAVLEKMQYHMGYIDPHESNGVVDDIYSEHILKASTVKGRILVTLYGEQQVGAAMSMFSLQKWAKTVNASVVEPFVQNSTFTLPIITTRQQLNDHLQFRDYFNINTWNSMSVAKNVTPLVSWNDFISQVPKKFIFVILLKKSHKEKRSIFVDAEMAQQRICNDTFISFLKNYNFYINNSKLVRRVCLSFYKTVMHIDQFTKTIYGNFDSSDTMVWFYLWKGFANNNRARVFQQYFYRNSNISNMLHASKKILDDGKNYVKKVLRSELGKYTAISIRTVLRAKHTSKINHMSFFQNCIDKLGDVINSMHISDQVLFLSMDLGRFGDMSANSYMSEGLISYIKEKIFQTVYNNSLTMEQWERSFLQATNGVTDHGYIAAIQRAILENSRCLVMFGGGSNFQRTLLSTYKENHRNETCFNEVCYVP